MNYIAKSEDGTIVIEDIKKAPENLYNHNGELYGTRVSETYEQFEFFDLLLDALDMGLITRFTIDDSVKDKPFLYISWLKKIDDKIEMQETSINARELIGEDYEYLCDLASKFSRNYHHCLTKAIDNIAKFGDGTTPLERAISLVNKADKLTTLEMEDRDLYSVYAHYQTLISKSIKFGLNDKIYEAILTAFAFGFAGFISINAKASDISLIRQILCTLVAFGTFAIFPAGFHYSISRTNRKWKYNKMLNLTGRYATEDRKDKKLGLCNFISKDLTYARTLENAESEIANLQNLAQSYTDDMLNNMANPAYSILLNNYLSVLLDIEISLYAKNPKEGLADELAFGIEDFLDRLKFIGATDDDIANDPFLSNLVKLIESIQENMAYEGAEVDMAEITKLAGAYISSKSERKTEEALDILEQIMLAINHKWNGANSFENQVILAEDNEISEEYQKSWNIEAVRKRVYRPSKKDN